MPHPDKFRRGIPIFRQKTNQNTTTVYLVGPDYWLKFNALSLEHTWLYQPVTEWSASKSYQEVKFF